MSEEGSGKAIIAALLANLGIVLTKFVAFFITNSSSRRHRRSTSYFVVQHV